MTKLLIELSHSSLNHKGITMFAHSFLNQILALLCELFLFLCLLYLIFSEFSFLAWASPEPQWSHCCLASPITSRDSLSVMLPTSRLTKPSIPCRSLPECDRRLDPLTRAAFIPTPGWGEDKCRSPSAALSHRDPSIVCLQNNPSVSQTKAWILKRFRFSEGLLTNSADD